MGKTRASHLHAGHTHPDPVSRYAYPALGQRQFVYASGQIALDPVSGELVGEDVQAQTHRALQNLQAVLSSAGTSLANIVKTTVFLAHMNDFQAMNAIYAIYFTGVAPARSTVAVAELPRKALVEIECVALIEDS